MESLSSEHTITTTIFLCGFSSTEIEIAHDLPLDKDGEEESRKHSLLLSGDGHAGRAVPEGQVVAESGDTSSSPRDGNRGEFTTLDTANLVELPNDSGHHPCYVENYPGTERGIEIGIDVYDADLA